MNWALHLLCQTWTPRVQTVATADWTSTFWTSNQVPGAIYRRGVKLGNLVLATWFILHPSRPTDDESFAATFLFRAILAGYQNRADPILRTGSTAWAAHQAGHHQQMVELANNYLSNPEAPLGTENIGADGGTALWLLFLENHYGPSIVLQLWTALGTAGIDADWQDILADMLFEKGSRSHGGVGKFWSLEPIHKGIRADRTTT